MNARKSPPVALIVLLLAHLAAPADPQDATEPVLPDQILGHMVKGHHPEAIRLLLEASRADPGNPVAWYCLGRAYNDSGLHGLAAEALLQSLKLGAASPYIRREIGIALAGLGRHQEAMGHLEHAPPDDARTAYFRGIVAYRLGRVTDAHKALARAEQDPVLKNRARRAREWIDARQAESKKWHLQLTLGTSWNTNATYLPHNAAIAAGDPDDREAPTATLALDARYDLYESDTTDVYGLFSFYETKYRHLEDWDQTGVMLGAYAVRRFDGWRAWAMPNVQKTLIDHDNYSTAFVLPVGVVKPITSWCEVEGNYTLRGSHFHWRAGKDEELDGATHHFAFGPTLWSPGRRIRAWAQLTFEEARPQGDMMQYKAFGVDLGARASLHRKVDVKSTLSLQRPDYTKPNTRHETGLKRADRWAAWYTALIYKLTDRQQIELFYSYIHNHSNIRASYKYDQRELGLNYRYTF